MQTAVGVFGGGDITDGVNVPPLMSANAGDSDRAAISSLNCAPFLAVELCREHLVRFPSAFSPFISFVLDAKLIIFYYVREFIHVIVGEA